MQKKRHLRVSDYPGKTRVIGIYGGGATETSHPEELGYVIINQKLRLRCQNPKCKSDKIRPIHPTEDALPGIPGLYENFNNNGKKHLGFICTKCGQRELLEHAEKKADLVTAIIHIYIHPQHRNGGHAIYALREICGKSDTVYTGYEFSTKEGRAVCEKAGLKREGDMLVHRKDKNGNAEKS